MSFAEASAYLEELGVDAMKSASPSLHRIEALCDALDHPERRVRAIHVTGTNGKTSTARLAASLLSATGLTVGTYTSPHLQRITERIARGGEPLGDDEFGDVFAHVRPYLDAVEARLGERLTFFEVLTGMFFLWAADAPVDAVVVEVGLGGRWDATNVVHGDVAVVTNVGLDHTALLGDARETIAKEKAGIVKPSSYVVTAERTPAILDVVEEQAAGVGARVAAVGRDFDVLDNRTAVGGRYLSVRTSARSYHELYVPLHGRHQGVNAATALEAVTAFLPARELDDDVVLEGLARTDVPGRLETIPGDGATETSVVLDVAHNPDGMSALVASLVEAFAFERVVFVAGILADKDHRGMLAEMARVPCALVATQARSMRSVDPDELRAAAADAGIECDVVPDVGAALAAARARAGLDDLVCVTGSHYVVGEARTSLLGPR
ncbi:MAG TPA: folylpolyglutamate synthase/dihydrofolate synthase family protein [Actinomycetota bacterium]|nr:folylpolyglutamate synthase/dihydrofolate synthase family protein [Actinomycetota bacterium]